MMAVAMDQHYQPLKHFCRICKKGFGCGRALGGHMRAHGITDDTASLLEPDEDPSASNDSDYYKKSDPSAGTKRMYALRANPNRLKSCRVCENCGKEFVSWKSFLEHGRCSSDDEAGGGGGGDSPLSDVDDDLRWSKGKRSRRSKVVFPIAGGPATTEEEDLANCLVMLSAARFDPVIFVDAEESCASASRDEDRPPVASSLAAAVVQADKCKASAAPPPPRGLFECKACKKVFTSHQALGGHRASHKKVKGCFAAKLDDLDVHDDDVITHDHDHNIAVNFSNSNSMNNNDALAMAIVPFDRSHHHHQTPPQPPVPLSVAPLRKKSKVHECSICHRVFASGQALGGHKRCHWITSNAATHNSDHHHQHHHQPQQQQQHPQLQLMPTAFEPPGPLDLNLPASTPPGGDGIGSPLRLDVPAAIYIQPWLNPCNNNESEFHNATCSNNKNIIASSNEMACNPMMGDEADSKAKLAKLSELKDITMEDEASPWLQVGIGSSTNENIEVHNGE